jgi:hypothetical protein
MGEPSLHRDRSILASLVVGLVLRALPMLIWGWAGDDCTRDECIFKIAARPILAGDGLGVAPAGWLPAPGYPYLLAGCHALFGSFESVKWVQWALSVPTALLLASTASRLGGLRAARWMAWMVALHPTLVFYVGTMWTESVYAFLLAAVVEAVLWARDGQPSRAALAGVVMGITVLNRGVATWITPILALGLVAPELWTDVAGWREGIRQRARHAGAFVLAAALVVAPYSASASRRWGGPVISDATLGHVISLGNDDYPPVTFDYAIGQLTGRLFTRTLHTGRRDCPQNEGPVAYDRCEVKRALGWIGEHPGEFVARIPIRLAQLFNPHSFLTRHILWNYWPGMPWELEQLLVLYQALCTWVIVGLGTFVAFARRRGVYGMIAAGTLVYYVVLISGLYGITRFRLPIEPLWMIWLAAFFADPRAGWAELRGSPARLALATALCAALTALMAVYAWTGFPGIGMSIPS